MDQKPSCGHCCGNCGGCGGGSGCCGRDREIVLDRPQAQLLAQFRQTPFLPLCRFLLHSSAAPEQQRVLLAPVFLPHGLEDEESVRSIGLRLERLAALGCVTLDYDLPLQGCDYQEFAHSPLLAQLRSTLPVWDHSDGTCYDSISVEQGSMALTALGQVVLEQLPELL